MATMDAAEILAKAADLVEHSGMWTQMPSIFDNRHICALLALSDRHQVLSRDDDIQSARVALTKELGLPPDTESGTNLDGIMAWNDAPGRTAVEVAAALRNAKRFLP